MKRVLQVVLVVIIVLSLVYAFLPGYLQQAVVHLFPGIEDYRIFSNRIVPAGVAQPWTEDVLYNRQEIPEEYIDEFLSYEPVSFLVIHEGNILFEQYYDGFGPESISNSFSMAKSIVALLIGAVLDDGHIESLDQPVKDFLPGYEIARDGKVTIRHLLEMSSGLSWDEQYASPFSITTQAYYGSDLEGLLQPIGYEGTPGKKFDYTSGTTQLLGFILQEATGVTISEYASQKLWKPMGAEHDALWSLDREDGMEKTYCCFNATARDFARLGQLVLQGGSWNGEQLIPEDFVREAVSASGNLVDDDYNIVDYYGFQFWILSHEGYEIPHFRGILGQYIFVIPELDAVVVRLGHDRADERRDNIPIDAFLYIDIALDLLRK